MPVPQDPAIYDASGSSSEPPTSFDPPPLSTAPEDFSESQPGGLVSSQDETEDQVAEEPEPLPEFDPKWRDEFTGLIYLGQLTHEFTWNHHVFKIKTLKSDELLEISLLIKPYLGSVAESRAYVTAHVAACLTHVDGQALPIPLTTDPSDTALSNRWKYIIEKWNPVIVDVVYEEYIKLEAMVGEVMAAMGKAQG